MKVRLLGSGTSTGVPRIGNDWGQCDPAEPRNRRTRAKLCNDCRANGWRWCTIGKHVIRHDVYLRKRYACHACYLADDLRRRHIAAGRQPTPPAGYIPLAVAADRVGFCRTWLAACLKDGSWPVTGWQRCERGRWYVEDRAVYPLPKERAP